MDCVIYTKIYVDTKNNVYFKKTYGVLITLNILSRGVCLPFSSNDSKGLVESGQNGFCSLWKKT